jgi:hypothetical protein
VFTLCSVLVPHRRFLCNETLTNFNERSGGGFCICCLRHYLGWEPRVTARTVPSLGAHRTRDLPANAAVRQGATGLPCCLRAFASMNGQELNAHDTLAEFGEKKKNRPKTRSQRGHLVSAAGLSLSMKVCL